MQYRYTPEYPLLLMLIISIEYCILDVGRWQLGVLSNTLSRLSSFFPLHPPRSRQFLKEGFHHFAVAFGAEPVIDHPYNGFFCFCDGRTCGLSGRVAGASGRGNIR